LIAEAEQEAEQAEQGGKNTDDELI